MLELSLDLVSEICKYLAYPEIKQFLQLNSICLQYARQHRSEIFNIRITFLKKRLYDIFNTLANHSEHISFQKHYDPPDTRRDYPNGYFGRSSMSNSYPDYDNERDRYYKSYEITRDEIICTRIDYNSPNNQTIEHRQFNGNMLYYKSGYGCIRENKTLEYILEWCLGKKVKKVQFEIHTNRQVYEYICKHELHDIAQIGSIYSAEMGQKDQRQYKRDICNYTLPYFERRYNFNLRNAEFLKDGPDKKFFERLQNYYKFNGAKSKKYLRETFNKKSSAEKEEEQQRWDNIKYVMNFVRFDGLTIDVSSFHVELDLEKILQKY